MTAELPDVPTHICKNCGITKPITEFYPHTNMRSGFQNECKQCARSRVEKRRKRLASTDVDWVLSEAERHRIKQAKYRTEGRATELRGEKKRMTMLRYEAKNPLKFAARYKFHLAILSGLVTPQPCVRCGAKAEGHHEDYTRPLDVVWLCTKHHAERHVEINNQRRIERVRSQANVGSPDEIS